MGCVCCSMSSFVSILLDALERVSLCTVCAMLVCCLFWTILIVLVMGIGVGYHYCFVQTNLELMAKAAKAMASEGGGGGGGDSAASGPVRSNGRRNVGQGESMMNRARRDADPDAPLTNNNTRQNLTKHYSDGFTKDIFKNSNTLHETNGFLAHFNITNLTSV